MKRLRLRVILFGLVAVWPLLGSLGCARHVHQGLLPKELAGAWTSDDPRYKERVMELSRAFVIIITGRHDPASVQMIDGVETESKGSETLFTVYSTDYSQGTHFQMKIQYSPANGGEIRFNNHGTVWTRHVEVQSKPAKKSR